MAAAVVWLLLSALREESGAYTTYILPKGYTIHNFTRLFTETELFNFPRWYMNTLIVAVLSCTITTFLTLMVAYTYSRLRFKARKKLMNVSLILGMFPGFMSMIAIYHFLKALGLAQSLAALVMVYSGGAALGYYVPKGFFDTIPRSLDEAGHAGRRDAQRRVLENHPAHVASHRNQHGDHLVHRPVGGLHIRLGHHEGQLRQLHRRRRPLPHDRPRKHL